MKLTLEDIEGNEYVEQIPKYPSAEIANKCESTFQAKVKATGSGEEESSVENAFQAIAKQKRIVVEWLNEKWFENDLGPERLAPPSQDKIIAQYADYIEGAQAKKKQEQTTSE